MKFGKSDGVGDYFCGEKAKTATRYGDQANFIARKANVNCEKIRNFASVFNNIRSPVLGWRQVSTRLKKLIIK